MTTDVSITEDMEGRQVVDATGEPVGIVTEVRKVRDQNTAFVDPDPDLTDKMFAKLGWTSDEDRFDRDDDSFPLQQKAIETVSDDEIRLTHGR